MKEFFRRHRLILGTAIFFLLVLPAIGEIFKPGWFRMHDDLQVMRQYEMDKCLRDGQIPCRWVPDMGHGYGFPLFNYYPPLPYLLGEILHLVGFGFIDTVKVVFALSLLASGLTMFLLAKEFFGGLGGMVAGLFYVWAPYRAVDIYVRGAMNESWAFVWFPAILWAAYRLIGENHWRLVPRLAFFFSLLLLTHNPMAMIFAPWLGLWMVFWLSCQKTSKFSVLIKLAVGGIWGLGLAAFFTLPVILESKYAHLETMVIGYFNYLAHFADLNQLFLSRFWGYGASFLGPKDEMSFSVGHLHWILSIISLATAWVIRKKNSRLSLMILLVFFLTVGSAFMTHSRSTPIWQAIKPLEFLQFPWRFLTLTTLGSSFLAGAVVILLERIGRKIFTTISVLLIVLSLVALNRDFFCWAEYWPTMTDQEKLSGKLWTAQTTSGIFDYLPIWASLPPPDPPSGDGEFIEGKGSYLTLGKNSHRQKFQVTVASERAVFQINTFYFPGWQVKLDNQLVAVDPRTDPDLGRIRVPLTAGNHLIEAEFNDTLVRRLGNILSLISWTVFFVGQIAAVRQIKKKH